MSVEILIHSRHTLIGKQNLTEVRRLRSLKKKIYCDWDHWGWSDIPLPQALFWWEGYGDLTYNVFYLIGLRWVEKFWVKGGDRAYLIPPSIYPRDMTSDQRKAANAFLHKGFDINDEQLKLGKITWASSQGTRGRINPKNPKGHPPEMLEVTPSSRKLWRCADFVVPIALEGTEKVSPINTWFPHFWEKMTVIVGKPIPATQDLDIGLERALLHVRYGDPRYAGFYRERAEEIVRVEREALLSK